MDDNLQKTDTYRQTTPPIILQPNFSQSYDYKTLTRRAQLVCDSPDSLTDEIKYLDNVFNKNNYKQDFIRHNTYRNSEPNATNTSATPVTTATIPYIKGTSETIARILQPYNICVAHKPITTLRQLLTNVKDKDKPSDRRGAVHKIKCCDCQATGRNLSVRLTEHKQATRNGDINNHIAEHHLKTNHRINWDSAECVTYSTNTNVNVTSNSPSQDYTHLDDHNLPNYDMTPGFKPFTVLKLILILISFFVTSCLST